MCESKTRNGARDSENVVRGCISRRLSRRIYIQGLASVLQDRYSAHQIFKLHSRQRRVLLGIEHQLRALGLPLEQI